MTTYLQEYGHLSVVGFNDIDYDLERRHPLIEKYVFLRAVSHKFIAAAKRGGTTCNGTSSSHHVTEKNGDAIDVLIGNFHGSHP